MNHFCRLIVAACAVGVLASGAPAATKEPTEVYRAYADAMAAGRAEEAARYVSADVKRLTLVSARPAAADAEKRYKAAVDEKFPGKRKDIAYPAGTTRPVDAVGGSHVVVTRDTATLMTPDSTDTVRFRQVDGEWKIDLDAMYSPATVDQIERFRGALVEVMNALAAEVRAGRFQKYEDVTAELATRIKMRLATPDLPATTRPAF